MPAVAPAVSVPMEREVPGELLRRLQAIDPMLQLAYVGRGEWWVLWYKPRAPRRDTGLRMLRHGVIGYRSMWLARMLADGWSLLMDFHCAGDLPSDWIVNEVQIRLGRTEAEMEQLYDEMEAESDGTRHMARVNARRQQYMQQEGRSIFAHAFKGRRSVGPHGRTPTQAPTRRTA